MSKLSKKISIILEMIDLFASKDEVILLIETLQQKYNLQTYSSSSPRQETPSQETEPKETMLPLEVVYSDGTRSYKKLSKQAIGVIIPGIRKLLYYDGSENMGTRSQAQAYIRHLPKGFNWHLMRREEAICIKDQLTAVNNTLHEIKGLLISSHNYMLEDDGQSQGYVRYVADL